jgi:hypothetical protein
MTALKGEVAGENSIAVTGTATGKSSLGVLGKGELWGVRGDGPVGVRGDGKTWNGVEGFSESTSGGFGVFGTNTAGGTGVAGVSKGWMGVYGKSESTTGGAGVMGEAVGAGVVGVSKTWHGVYGETASTAGGAGVWGESKADGNGVVGIGRGFGVGVHGKGGRLAGYFEGDVEVTGDIRRINADCAEDFDICEMEQIEPGTVMVLGEEGVLYPSQQPYDKRVAGVISGAGNYKPGIVLDKQESDKVRKPIALVGKVFCKVDARYGAIEVGDLLTTSPTPGHAMKADDPLKAFGTVIGKALRPLAEDQGLIPILIALQ